LILEEKQDSEKMKTQELSKIRLAKIEAAEIERVYNGLLDALKELSGLSNVVTLRKNIDTVVNFIIKKLASNGQSLLLYTSKIFDKDYIFAHSLDVCIISLRIGQRQRFPRERLMVLGFLALTHAREDVGFPEGLTKGIARDEEIGEIIRLADIYDALTHSPSYRHGMEPKKTLESIISSETAFDRRLVKILLEELSLYPMGAWVELSTKEIGRVIEVNKGLLLRPVVRVYIDREGEYVEEEKIIDLSKNNLVHIAGPLADEEAEKIMES
jgi:HD-GYP domain-containing protein (c-di-GMP phosphodiesterase class II)